MSRVVLSERLRMLADMVTAGSRVADVGCDHGFLSIWLVQAGVSCGGLAMDVRKGPLAAARKNIETYGVGDYIETRLSDGLRGCGAGEADTLVCAGMGGRLMERILAESMEKARGFKELILQPQSELEEFRFFLRREGFAVLREEAVREDGKFYFAMKAAYGTAGGKDGQKAGAALTAAFGEKGCGEARMQRICDRFGERLLTAKHPVLLQYLMWRRKCLEQLADSLEAGVGPETGSERQRLRLQEILLELSDVEYALAFCSNI